MCKRTRNPQMTISSKDGMCTRGTSIICEQTKGNSQRSMATALIFILSERSIPFTNKERRGRTPSITTVIVHNSSKTTTGLAGASIS